MRDFIEDQNPVPIYRLISQYERDGDMPEYLEDYQVPESTQLVKVAADLFADPLTRTYPLHDKASTLMSAAYFYGTPSEHENHPEVAERISKAAKAHDIEKDVEFVMDSVKPPVTKSASEDPDYALQMRYEDEDGVRNVSYLPVNSMINVEESARALSKSIEDGSLPSHTMHKCASTIVEKAKVHGVPQNAIPENVRELAVPRLISKEASEDQLSLRKSLVSEDVGATYEDLFKYASEAKNSEEVEECLNLLDELDSEYITLDNPLVKMAFKRGHEALHSGITEDEFNKAASEVVLMDVNGKSIVVPLDEITSLDPDVITSQFSKEAAASVLEIANAKDNVDATVKLRGLDEDIRAHVLDLVLD